jgi:hypothetical protein
MSDSSYDMQGRAVPEPHDPGLEDLTHLVARALHLAHERLRQRMAHLGLTAERGWRVKEELRHTGDGTEWILSPIHLREASPEMEERVRIDAEGRLVTA